MAAREFLMIVIESSWGTAKSTPSLGTDKCYLRLDQGNAFSMEAEPVQSGIMFGGGLAVEAETVSDVVQCKGNFNFILYPGIWSNLLLNWAITPINSGRTTPWTTTDSAGVNPVGDTASLSFYHAYMNESGTYRRTRYAGVKCDDWQLAASESGDGRIWRISGSCTGIRPVGNAWDSSSDPDATEFPAPADANYPTGPYTFGHLASGTGTVTLGSSSGTNRAATCAGLTIRARNKYAQNYFTSRFLGLNRFVGRESTCEANLRLKVSPNDRDSYRALTAQTVSVILDNGTNSATLTYNGNNVLRPWARDLPLDREYMQKLTFMNRYSATAGGDISVTLT